MNNFIITLLFGWLGVHKFMQKKYVLGTVYLFTLGLFGIGWTIDTIMAFIRMVNGKQPETQKPNTFSSEIRASGNQLIKSFDTVIVGTFAKCDLDPESKREDLIFCVKPNWELSLKHWEYKGNPAYYVLHPNGADLGNIREGLAKILYDEYRDCEFKVYAIKKGYDDVHDCATYNIRIDIYR
ncbi:TM2 domain-containing protein [Lachnospiraceae bacterium 29-84]